MDLCQGISGADYLHGERKSHPLRAQASVTLTLVDIPATQRHKARKEIERLAKNLRSMHLAVQGAVAHLYHIQRAQS